MVATLHRIFEYIFNETNNHNSEIYIHIYKEST